jgi:hypothetical protein
MGEAKRRKDSDTDYGRPKPHERGLIVSAPITVTENVVQVRSTHLNPNELRAAILFWDRLAWPTNNALHVSSEPDAQYLESTGVMVRPIYNVPSGSLGDIVSKSFSAAFQDLNAREPGRWAMSQGENSLLVRDGLLEPGRGQLVQLYRAIPVPAEDVPLADILEFKEKRRDELLALREQIDAFYSTISTAEDADFEMMRAVGLIDQKCVDLLRVTKARGFQFKMTDASVSFDLDSAKSGFAEGAVLGGAIGKVFDMPAIGAAVGGALGVAASMVKVELGFGVRKNGFKDHPYRYVYHLHDELK